MSAPATSREQAADEVGAQGTSVVRTVGRAVPLALLWLGTGTALAAVTARARDWFAMPNELLSERRAIAVADTFSPLPMLHRQFVSSFDQLYPLAIAPMFRYGSVLADVRNAHVLNAYLMTSACIPAFLLARRVTASRPLAYLVAGLSVFMPWIFFAALLMDEVVAYPVFLWALLAFQRTLVAPSRGRDAAALGVIAAAYFSRPQLGMLALVLPIAIGAYELGVNGRPLGGAARSVFANHRLAAVVYAVGAGGAVVLFAAGRLDSTLGVYAHTITRHLISNGVPKSLVWHLAAFSIGVGILPLVAGLSWLLARTFRPAADPEQQAFACLGATAAIVLLVEVTLFDVRYIDGVVLDRYLMYLVPIVFLAFVCALQDPRGHRISLALVTAAVAAGFIAGAIPTESAAQINSDAPIQTFYPAIVSSAGSLTATRILLAGGTALLSFVFVAGRALLSRRNFLLVFAVVPLAVVPYLTVDLFAHFFHDRGTSERAVTSTAGASYSWIDQRVGAHADVTIVPYPTSTAYLVGERVWRDYEFWNKSVDRDVQLSPPGVFDFTNQTFPKLYPTFDPKTGVASVSGGPWVVQGDQETRARISGTVAVAKDVMLIQATQPWRADWISSGLYDDGWTRPGRTAHVRVFAVPSASRAQLRSLTFLVRTADGSPPRAVTITADNDHWTGSATPDTTSATVSVCVPAHGYSDVAFRAPASATIPGDQRTWADSDGTRIGGVFISQISLADEIGGNCVPGQSS